MGEGSVEADVDRVGACRHGSRREVSVGLSGQEDEEAGRS